MGTKIIFLRSFCVFILLLSYSNAYSIKSGFYKATGFNDRYCYVRNDTIWFNYGMPVGEGYIRFAKGIVHEDGFIQMLKIKDKMETLCDTVFIKRNEKTNQLLLNVYDFRSGKEIVKPIKYFIHQDSTYHYEKRIFLREPFNYVDSNYILDYSAVKFPKTVISFASFDDDFDLSDKIETVYLEIRKNEQAKYKIVLAPRVSYSEHFSEIEYTYEENSNELSLHFTKKIDGFPNHVVLYLPLEQNDMCGILESVYLFHIKP